MNHVIVWPSIYIYDYYKVQTPQKIMGLYDYYMNINIYDYHIISYNPINEHFSGIMMINEINPLRKWMISWLEFHQFFRWNLHEDPL